jgi:hypothetical protein
LKIKKFSTLNALDSWSANIALRSLRASFSDLSTLADISLWPDGSISAWQTNGALKFEYF